MAIDTIKATAILDGAVDTADLGDGAVTAAKLDADAVTPAAVSDTANTSTGAFGVPTGTTAQRANTQSGDIRFNSTISLMEYYDGVQWKSIDSPPTIS